MNTEPQPLEGIILTPEAPDGLVSLTTAKPLDLFTTPTVITALLAAVRTEATRDFTPDLTTDKGRKAIASRAFKVARTKTFLDGIGKDEVARLKELPRLVDAGRKALRDGLDQLADQIRKPLTEWEDRRDVLQKRLAIIQNTPASLFNADCVAIRSSIETVTALDPAGFEEFAGEAETTRRLTLATLQEMLEKREKWEADQAELQRLREEKEAREKSEREEALRKEGEERARKTAEAAALAAQPPTQAPAPQTATDQQAHPPVPAPAPAQSAAVANLNADLEHRRARNREALADLADALVLANIFTKDDEGRQAAETTAKAVLTAIVTGKVRHLAIAY